MNYLRLFAVLFFCLSLLVSCVSSEEKKEESILQAEYTENTKKDKEMCLDVMRKHLDAVTTKDLVSLKETLSPLGNMQLIVPQSEIIDGVDGFMEYHKEWFAVPNWTFETKILNSYVGGQLAYIVTEIVYREPERNGVPYFNRMIVSYDLKKIDGQWFVVKDHASSVEKSTDKED